MVDRVVLVVGLLSFALFLLVALGIVWGTRGHGLKLGKGR